MYEKYILKVKNFCFLYSSFQIEYALKDQNYFGSSIFYGHAILFFEENFYLDINYIESPYFVFEKKFPNLFSNNYSFLYLETFLKNIKHLSVKEK